MALIKCPECKKKISDQCENCPQCGYPIKNSLENENSIETDIQSKKPFYKKIWVWIVAGVVLAALVLGAILLLNRDTQPKLDKDGNPVFVELTNEVYTNAKKYKGYHINIKGKVFQVMGDNGNVKGIQIWLDPDTCEQNLMIYYNTDAEVQQGDYIMCSGYIDSVTAYKNAYDAKLHVPLVYSTDLKKATYIDVISPTIETFAPKNLKQEKYGYSVTIDKVEFSEKETRVYATTVNNGKAILYFGDAVIVQNGKQYNSTTNYDADYDEIPYEIVKGVTSSGIIVFPAIESKDFDLTISIHSDDYDEEIKEFKFKLSNKVVSEKIEESKPVQTPTKPQTQVSSKPKEYASLVGTFIGPEGTVIFNSDGTLYFSHIYYDYSKNDYEYVSFSGEWMTIQDRGNCTLVYDDCGEEWNAQEFIVSQDGIDGFLGDFYTRRIYAAGSQKSQALVEAQKYRDRYPGKILTIYSLAVHLTALGYDDIESTFALENAEGFHDCGAMYEEERVDLFIKEGYSKEEIIDFYEGLLSYSDASYLVEECIKGNMKNVIINNDGEIEMLSNE